MPAYAIGRSPLRDSIREKLRRILEEIPWTFEAGVGASELAEATGYSSQSIAMLIRYRLHGVEVESMQSGERKVYKRIARRLRQL